MKYKLRIEKENDDTRNFILVKPLTRVTSSPLTHASLSTKITKIKVAQTPSPRLPLLMILLILRLPLPYN
jgi:hypothetical protein